LLLLASNKLCSVEPLCVSAPEIFAENEESMISAYLYNTCVDSFTQHDSQENSIANIR
jgi:hypothetical protein